MEQPQVHHPLRDGCPSGGGEPGGRHPVRRRTVHPRPQGHPVCLLSLLSGEYMPQYETGVRTLCTEIGVKCKQKIFFFSLSPPAIAGGPVSALVRFVIILPQFILLSLVYTL